MQLPDWARDPRARKALAAVLAILAVLGITVTVADNDNNGVPNTVTVHVDSGDPGKAADKTVEVPKPVVQKAAETTDHENLRTPGPAVPQDQLDQAERKADQIRETTLPLPTGGATAGFAGCKTAFVRNQSSRNGVRPSLFVLHYTVSRNVPGWADVNAIVALFDNSARQASSNFVIDAEGHCAYIVPIENKAWTQAAGNPFSISVEVVAFGDEPAYLGPQGWAKLRSVFDQVRARTGIPARQGAVSGCAPARSGIVQHKDFGICGGGHVDITPFSLTGAVRRLTAAAAPSPLTATERKIVRGACHPKGTGHSEAYWDMRATRQINRLAYLAGKAHSWKPKHRGVRRKLLARARAGKCG
jgi:hypothetical protein